MSKESKKKGIVRRHIAGVTFTSIIAVLTALTYKVYVAFQAPLEARIAAKQVEDSMAYFALHQQMEAVPAIIVVVGIGIALTGILPLIKDLVGRE
jgi:putative exporter of polyketide antibiotics